VMPAVALGEKIICSLKTEEPGASNANAATEDTNTSGAEGEMQGFFSFVAEGRACTLWFEREGCAHDDIAGRFA
jgi:hypothetical protein